MGDDASRLACRRIVRDLIAKYEWTLLEEDELIELVMNSNPEISPTKVERLAKHYHSITLYEACRQSENLDRREQGYRELHRLLFHIAYNRWPELAEDTTQRTLLLVYEQIDRCQHPGTFLAFALNKLRHALKQEHQASKREQILDEASQDKIGRKQAASGPDLEEKETCHVLLDAIKRLAKDHEQQVVLLKYYGGLSDEEMAERLGITVNYVRVLRHRAKIKLRQDEGLRDYVQAL